MRVVRNKKMETELYHHPILILNIKPEAMERETICDSLLTQISESNMNGNDQPFGMPFSFDNNGDLPPSNNCNGVIHQYYNNPEQQQVFRYIYSILHI